MKNKKILVTGGAGYIGSVACGELLKEGFQVIVIDDFSTGFREPLKLLAKNFGEQKIRWYEADIKSNLDKIFTKEKEIFAVIHYTGPCSVDESMRNPYKYFSTHTWGTLNLLNYLDKYSVKNIIYSSTCAVYGEIKKVPVDESYSTQPINPYGQSKLMAEQIIEWFSRLCGIRYIILRYFNVCGATDDGLIGDSKKPSVHLVQNLVRGALGIEKFLLTAPKVKTPDGTPIRDYVDVVDLAEAHIKALKHLENGGVNQIINIGTSKGYSVKQTIKEVERELGTVIKVEKTLSRVGEYATMVASNLKAKKVLGWKPTRDIRHSIQTLTSWYKRSPFGWTQ